MGSILESLSFSREYLRAALLVSLLSVWVLVGLFYYLNRYTKRDYFTTWTAAWLFYALWLTLNLRLEGTVSAGLRFSLAQCCVATSSVFLFWGSLRFLDIPVKQTLFGLFLLFVMVWSVIGPQLAVGPLQIELPVFLLIGAGSMFAAACFFRFRKQMPFVGAGMLALGFLLWGLYLISYPFSQQYESLFSAGHFMAAVLQLFIAVSMIVLVLEEVRLKNEQAMAETAAVRLEKQSLELKVITAEETCRNLYDEVRASKGKQQAYDELRRTQDLIVRQERLRAIGQMASGLVHDLNNLLTPITCYAALILRSPTNLPASVTEKVGKIKKAAEDIARVVGRMRNFSRPRSDEDRMEMVNVNQTIAEVVELTRPRWLDLPQQEGIHIHVNCDLSPQLPLLLSDASELRQALANLVFNSVDALPNGGTITFSTRAFDRPPADPGGSPVSAIQIEVRDDGLGMDENTRQRCLEPFFSTKVDQGGTGLGLAMVYGTVQRLEGDIEIVSSLGTGTCIRLTLPVQAVRKPELDATPQIEPSLDQSTSLRVLYVDDQPMVRDVIGASLRSLKHNVTLAADGETGMQIFETAMRGTKPFDAVITDLGMPQMNGRAMAKVIKAQYPSMPVIMLTGWASKMTPEEGDDAVVDAMLAKPASLEDLNNALLQVGERHSLPYIMSVGV